MSRPAVAWSLVFAVSLTVGANAQDADRVRKEQKRLEGTWKAVSIESEGEKAPADLVKNFELTFKGNAFTLRMGQEKREGTYKLDLARRPPHIDIRLET